MGPMKRIKNWFINRFLPMWAKEMVLDDNRKLAEEAEKLRRELDAKNAYISGMVAGIKYQRRIVINTAEGKNGK